MSRIQKLENIYQEQLKNHQVDNVSNFIQSILNTDITKGKYARFLIEAFINDKFLEEDLIGELDSTVGQAISLFHKHKSKLPENMRSVYALNPETGEALYQSPGDLWNSVKQFQGELSGKELKREEQEKIYRETEFIYKDEETGFQIISPLTEESAKWWGKGTRWCTSAENNNRFWNYAKQLPLLILLMPASANTAGNGQKLQLWNNNNDIQFMDESDNTVSLNFIEQHWKLLEPICLWLNDFRFIPDKYKTQEICLNAFTKNLWALEYIPEYLRTEELFRLAVTQNWKALECIPDEYITPELCELAVIQDGGALEYVPLKLITQELCELAVKSDGESLKFVSYKYKNYHMCLEAVKQNGWALEYIPDKYKTKELYKLAIKQEGRTLSYIPKDFKTKELCELAIRQDGRALAFIPEHLKTEELCKLAVQENGWSLKYIPDELKTLELCELAVQENGWSLSYVPKELRTKELCKIAVQQNGSALSEVPRQYRTEELCKLAILQKGEALSHVPEGLRTKEFCLKAVQQSGYAIIFVPEKLKTKELCELAVKQNELALEYIPKKLQKHVKNNILKEIPIDKYQETFQKIKTLFPENHVSLSYHHS